MYSSSQKKLESSRESCASFNANAQRFPSCSRRVRAFRACKRSCISRVSCMNKTNEKHDVIRDVERKKERKKDT